MFNRCKRFSFFRVAKKEEREAKENRLVAGNCQQEPLGKNGLNVTCMYKEIIVLFLPMSKIICILWGLSTKDMLLLHVAAACRTSERDNNNIFG